MAALEKVKPLSREYATSWTEQQVRDLLAREHFAYQRVPLPFGLATSGHDRTTTAAAIFPEDMTGKSVLDLGCSYGFFCFEAWKRGASRVVGIDVDPDSLRKARLLADCLGADVQFEQRDVEETPITEEFDYVLALNLLHHLSDPLTSLNGLLDISKDRLILEVATMGAHDRRKLGLNWLLAKAITALPIIYVAPSGTKGKRELQKLYVTGRAIENLLMRQRGSVARLMTVRSEHKGRFIAIAEKWRIGHLVVVSGPTSSGKKTLMRKLRANELPELNAALDTPDGSAWGMPLNANHVGEPTEPHRERLLLHYDFLRPYLRSARTHHRDEALDLINCAEHVTFVTVWTPPARLREQIKRAEIDPRSRAGRENATKRHSQILSEYHDPMKVIAHYRDWFAYTRTKKGRHFVVTLGDKVELQSVEEWEKSVADLPAGSLRTRNSADPHTPVTTF